MMKPVIMGSAMGAMMMWMLHGMLTGDSFSGWALVVFVAAHVVLAVLVAAGIIFAARLSPRAQRVIAKLHRPSLKHIGTMMLAAGVAGGVIHLVVHGGIA